MHNCKTCNVIVYGTLKEDFSANYLLQPGKLVNKCVKLNGFKMYTNGGYPMVVPGLDTDFIIGEEWKIPVENLIDLDQYEGEPHLFKRIQLPNEETYIYLYNNTENMNIYQEIKNGIFK